ncbi:hypothetical protein L3Q67_01125 [Saccharothrix sp. AJ9571]|nr:hypothetical protein L3Q67_01125 [Saccharothrix sp. AJ9571]
MTRFKGSRQQNAGGQHRRSDSPHVLRTESVRQAPLLLWLQWLADVLTRPLQTMAADAAVVLAPMAVRISEVPGRGSVPSRADLAGPPPGWVVHPVWVVLGVVTVGLAAGALAAAVVVR